MKVVVDTCIWSQAFRRTRLARNPVARALHELIIERRAVLLGIVLQEILQGIRSTEQFERLRDRLTAFSVLAGEPDDHVEAARLWNRCRGEGIQIGTVDAYLAAVATRRDWSLYTEDGDFEQISAVSPIRLWVPAGE